MGYTYRYKVETRPANPPVAFMMEFSARIGAGIYNGDQIKVKPHHLREDFFHNGKLLSNYHAELLALSKEFPGLEIRIWSVGEECWDDYSGHRGDIQLLIVQNGEVIKDY